MGVEGDHMPVREFLSEKGLLGAEVVDALLRGAVSGHNDFRGDIEVESDIWFWQDSFEEARAETDNRSVGKVGQIDDGIVEIPIRNQIVAIFLLQS